jgi:osmotically-inducible protein OsmY
MSRRLAPLLALLLAGCAGHGLNTRAADSWGNTRACQSIRSAVLARDASALTVLDVLCNGNLVVIAGALPPDYKLAVEAVHIARTTPGVSRVETFFVPRSAREASDAALAVQVKSAVAGSDGAAASATDLTVIGGTVVLVGVVHDQARADRLVASAGAVSGVRSVKSFLQVKP